MEETISSKKNKVICNIAYTKYDIIKHVVEQVFSWTTSAAEDDSDCDLLWTDSAITPDKLTKMKLYQKINHFPGMYAISRKNYLAYNLNKLKKIYPNEYNFFPRTWVVPCDIGDLKNFIQNKKKSYLIVKPEASCQGRGIFLTKKIEDIDTTAKHVVQEYINKPYLIDDLKFDLRIYVLLTGCSPLRIFIHREGLTRFATETYVKPSGNNINNVCMHLTNYAVNKSNPNFIQNKDAALDNQGHKRSLQSTLTYLETCGKDTKSLMSSIEDIIIKTICTIQPSLSHHYKSCQPDDFSNSMCFEILGFDIILDSTLKPYVLEVNHTPSFSTDSPLDFSVKKNMIGDAIRLLGISSNNRTKFIKKNREEIFKRSMTGKIERISKGERDDKMAAYAQLRNSWEKKHLGGYKKIYPVAGYEKYNQFVATADEIWKEWTGVNINRKKNLDPVPRLRKKLNVECIKQFNHNETYDGVFERLSRPITRKFKDSSKIFPSIVYKNNFKNSEKPQVSLNCLNLFYKGIEQDRKKKKESLNKGSGPIKLDNINPPKAQEKKLKKVTLKEVLSLDNLNGKLTFADYKCEKKLETSIF
jgi:tubulin polyglutamylase TTLL6/13